MKITKWNVIGAIAAFAFGGPLALLIFVSGHLVFWYYMSKRGLLFIQSYVYLATLRDTSDPVKANWLANDLTPTRARAYAQLALDFANRHNGGMQLPVIQEAKDQGFIYKGKTPVELFK